MLMVLWIDSKFISIIWLFLIYFNTLSLLTVKRERCRKFYEKRDIFRSSVLSNCNEIKIKFLIFISIITFLACKFY